MYREEHKFRNDITGKSFNDLTALYLHEKRGSKQYWVFKCKCGKEAIKRRDQVANGKFKHCGNHQGNKSHKHIEILGEKRGKLKAIKRVENNKTNHQQYLFLCDCGNTKVISKGIFCRGEVKSCGCTKEENLKTLNYTRNDDPQMSAMNTIIYQYKKAAKRRNISFTIQDEDFIQVTKGNCYFCGEIPSKILKKKKITQIYNGVDRLNNKLGYTKENCVPCCTICNRMKMAHTMEVFLNKISLIFKKHIENKNV